MAFKKIIFSADDAHLSQVSTTTGTPNKSAGDLETTKLFANTVEGGVAGDIDKIVVNVGGELKHVAQSLIDSSESDLIPGTGITSTGGNWNGVGAKSFSLNFNTIDGLGLSNDSDKLIIKEYDNSNIDIASGGIKISSSIVDTAKGLSFTSNKIVANIDTNTFEFNSGTGAIDRKSGTTGFASLRQFSNGNISNFDYNGTGGGPIVVDTTTLDGNAQNGIRSNSSKIFLATASALTTGDTIRWIGASQYELSETLITEVGTEITIGTGAQTASIAGPFVAEKDVDIQGSTNRVKIADKFIVVNADSSDPNNFGFQSQFSNGQFPQWQYQNATGTGNDRWGYSIGTNDGTGNTFVGYQRLVTDSNLAPAAVESQTGKILRKGNMTVDSSGDVWMYTANS